ncbi:MAG: glycosyltransferase, partial [Chloroflexi bacterium]|nr:glycosyltransferase [Chloroflexota bacterium]
GDMSAFPDYAASLRQAATRHPGIRFAGPAPHEAVGDILRQFDYLVVPSLWRETFGMVVQEAEAAGTPVIASRIGALQRVQDGLSGRLFEPGDIQGLARILRDLYDHPEKRALYRAHLTAGPLLADQAQRLVEIYQALIERRPLP